MKNATRRTLKTVIDILDSRTEDGANEPGEAEAIAQAIRKLKRALQKKDHEATNEAIDFLARLVLEKFR